MDIVERLRSPEVFIMDGPMISPVAFEAADEIIKLRKALKKIAPEIVRVAMKIDKMHDIVREALKEPE
jgi:hypothetical protein